jgi:purine nucleosidase
VNGLEPYGRPEGSLRMIVDTDTASDDAVALVMALRDPGVTVEAITVVAGNVPLAQGVQNALYTAELCEVEVPVHAGADRPLTRVLRTAQFVHGEDGMGDLGLPLSGRSPAQGHAVDVLRERIRNSVGELTLVALGPLTNIALALALEPSLASQVRHCIVMGSTGGERGNVTPVADYNFWVDPEAARIVLASGMPLTVVGWDISRKYAAFSPADEQRLRELDTPLARFAVDIQCTLTRFARETSGLPGFDLPDPVAMAFALDPAVATAIERVTMLVDTSDGLTEGQTIIDHLGTTKREANVHLVRSASRDRFIRLLERSLRA